MSTGAQASLIGVAIACGGNILISLALTVQKLAHRRREEEAEAKDENQPLPLHHPHPQGISQTLDSPSPLTRNTVTLQPSPPPSPTPPTRSEAGYLRSRLWWLGLGLMGIGEMGNFLSYGFAPASVVAPLGTVALIANCVFAPVVLGESFTKRNLLGMGLAIIGAATVVWSSRDDNKRLSPDELFAAITTLPFLLYTAVNVALMIPLRLLSSSPWGDRYIGIDVGLCALFGGYTVMSTKALSSLLSAKFILALKYPITWGAIVVLVVTSILQIKFLNRALMRFESKEVIPTQFVFFSLSAIIGSAVLYQEFRGVSRSDFVNFAFGIATTFLGVYFLTTPADSPEPSEDMDEDTPLLTPDRRTSVSNLTPQPGMHAGPSGQRLIKHASQNNLDIGLALNSPASLLLLATTPPTTTTPATVTARSRRNGGVGNGSHARSASASRGTLSALEALMRRGSAS